MSSIPRVFANFCNLFDSTGRPIYSACLAGQSPDMQAEWIQRERDAGGTHYVICTYSGYHDLYGEQIHWFKAGRFTEWLAALDRILAADLIPVVMLDPGDAYPGNEHFRQMLAAIPREYYPRCLWVPAFEPVAGAWSSRQFFDCSNIIREGLGPDPLMGCHLTPGRAQFSSNPPEANDPWGGKDNWECWREHWPGGHHPFAAFLYQSPVAPEGRYLYGTDEWCSRAQEVAERFLPGRYDQFGHVPRPTLVWFECTAFSFIRHQSTSAWAVEVAKFAQGLGFEGFGNGLPDPPPAPSASPSPSPSPSPRRRRREGRPERDREGRAR